MVSSKSIRLFVAMPGTDMGPGAHWNNPEQIKRRFFEKIKEDLEHVLSQKVDLVIEKDKVSGGAVHPSMFKEAWDADVYIADLTGNNPNVYLELGVRWAVKDNVTVVVSQNIKDVRFNVSSSRIIPYEMDFDNLDLAREKVVHAIKEGLERSEYCDSPVRQSAEIKTYRRKYVEGLEKEIRQLKSEQGRDYINAARAAEKSQDRIDLFRKALEVNPNLDEALFYLGVELRIVGEYDNAIISLGRAVALNPASAVYHRELGVAYSKNSQLKEARSEFDEAVALNPKDDEAWSNRGGLLRRLGSSNFPSKVGQLFLTDARNSYNEAYKINKLNQYALGNMARLDLILSTVDPHSKLIAEHELKKLKSLCEYKLEDQPAEKYWLMFDIADSYLLLGEVDEGLRLYEEAIAAVPNDRRKSVLSSVYDPLENLISLETFEDKVKIASKKILEKLRQMGNF